MSANTQNETPEERAERCFREDAEKRDLLEKQTEAEYFESLPSDEKEMIRRMNVMAMENGRKGCNSQERLERLIQLEKDMKKYENKDWYYRCMDDIYKGISNKMYAMVEKSR